jgi:hypothetical protein
MFHMATSSNYNHMEIGLVELVQFCGDTYWVMLATTGKVVVAKERWGADNLNSRFKVVSEHGARAFRRLFPDGICDEYREANAYLGDATSSAPELLRKTNQIWLHWLELGDPDARVTRDVDIECTGERYRITARGPSQVVFVNGKPEPPDEWWIRNCDSDILIEQPFGMFVCDAWLYDAAGEPPRLDETHMVRGLRAIVLKAALELAQSDRVFPADQLP